MVGGAAVIGAMGIVGIATLQRLNTLRAQKAGIDKNTGTCCELLEDRIKKLHRDINEHDDDLVTIQLQQQSLCNLVNMPIFP